MVYVRQGATDATGDEHGDAEWHMGDKACASREGHAGWYVCVIVHLEPLSSCLMAFDDKESRIGRTLTACALRLYLA